MSLFHCPYRTKSGFLRNERGILSPATLYLYDNGLIVIEDHYDNKYEGQRESDVSYLLNETDTYQKFLVAE